MHFTDLDFLPASVRNASDVSNKYGPALRSSLEHLDRDPGLDAMNRKRTFTYQSHRIQLYYREGEEGCALCRFLLTIGSRKLPYKLSPATTRSRLRTLFGPPAGETGNCLHYRLRGKTSRSLAFLFSKERLVQIIWDYYRTIN